MKRALGRYARIAVALVAIWAVGIAAGIFVVSHQNGEFPAWIPFIGDDPYVVHAEMSTAQGVIPGQGQLVQVAGVIVGRVSGVEVVDGRAVLEIHLERGKVRLFRDASALLRPRTLLKDMLLEVTPGTPSAGPLREADTIPVSRTLPDVNVDDLLSALDADTRAALIALAQGGGQGLAGQDRRLAAVFRRFDPTMEMLWRINKELLGRRRELARVVESFSRISSTLARNRTALSRFVGSSGAVLGALADEQAGLRSTLAQLPATLRQVTTTSDRLVPLADDLRAASRGLEPGARALGPGATSMTGLFTATAPVLRTQLRPFARDARAPLGQLRAATDGIGPTSAAAATALSLLTRFFDELAYAKPGTGGGSQLLWAAWLAHQLNSVFSAEDALGPYAHTLTMTSCESLRLLPGFASNNPALALDVTLANLPTQAEVCPT
jgi:phospholipid/cholesterol/gamma-HCH transport system substrate-binding protein